MAKQAVVPCLTQNHPPAEPLGFEELVAHFDVEDFDHQAEAWMAALDSQGVAVRCDFGRKRRSSFRSGGISLLHFYRNEVQQIPVMTREEELRFCMGLEFLWRRLQAARTHAGFDTEEVERFPGGSDLGCIDCPPGRERICDGCAPIGLPALVRARLRARNQEFHAVRNELIERNLYLVFRLLERYRNVGVPMEDMIQEANLSLFKAVENFDFRRGVRFKTYATYWVNQAFLNAIYNQSRTVRVPAYIQKAMKKISDTAATVGPGLRDTAAISKHSGVPEDLVLTAMRGNRFTLSLDRSLDEDDGSRMVDLVEDDRQENGDREELLKSSEADKLQQHLREAMEGLTHREQAVLSMRFGLDGQHPSTLAVVGERLKISLERVRQIQKAALEKLRLGGKARQLSQYA
ncbi:MAG: RNA polymerase sigma factor RpoD/SigA [Planctomycetota bacterium]|nr:MAG: RNA polymerase sigma factor RpoD/SigA [Planctomycetota bacterium]